jgi:hypothetical protein
MSWSEPMVFASHPRACADFAALGDAKLPDGRARAPIRFGVDVMD